MIKKDGNFMTIIRLVIFYILLVTTAYFGGTVFEHIFGLGSASTLFLIMLGMFIVWFFYRAFKETHV